MSADKRKNQNTKSSPPKVAPRPVATPPPPVPPLFRPVDWLAFGISTLVVFIVFFLTLAPNVTLEDSGEMATASLYGGIPHAPGYPVWTLYTWLWTHIPSWKHRVARRIGQRLCRCHRGGAAGTGRFAQQQHDH